jgi:hypothetical protein
MNSVEWEMECPLTSARIGLPVGTNCQFESGSLDQLEKAQYSQKEKREEVHGMRHAGHLPDFLWEEKGRLDHRSCGWVCGGRESREAENVRAKKGP